MFRAIFVITLLLNIHSPLHAEESKPNTLTPKEIAEGWILLFDGETTFGWTSKDLDNWSVRDGILGPQAGNESPLISAFPWNAYVISAEYKSTPRSGVKLLLGCDMHGDRVPGMKKYERVNPTDNWAGFEQEVPSEIGGGFLALDGEGVRVRAIKLKPLNMKPLFNGKDLAGWKKFDSDPAKGKSEFTVTKDGCIHLKNGPGDLQTEGQYKDFILQAECFSNGDRLNSGIFFRCLPDQYQQGYEAQIHNGFTEKPEKEYTLEEYDPETHKLTGTKKVKYAAKDYGTGGIYRRVPAQRAVAKDKEWFTMTVVAHGRHVATWVNGIQVVDWTDNRPENDNARNGCKLGKGAISLQGHDATTDLSFRNIRIAELPLGDKK